MKNEILCTDQLLAAFVAILALVLAPHVSAQTNIWSNPITGVNPNLSNPYTTGDVVASDITVSGIGRGSGISGNTANDRYNATGWTTSTSIDLTEYFEFTLTPASGFEIDFDSFVYTGQRSSSGPTSFAFRSSADSFASNIGSPTATGTTISLSGASFQNITSGITFRLYGWNATGGTFSINSFYFTGTVNPVVGPGDNLYWAGDGSTLGGAGTWDDSLTRWSAEESPVTAVAWDETKTAVFAGTSGGEVAVGTVNADKGIQFSTNGYTLSSGTITLGGATIADNTITTGADVSATIDSVLTGTTGLTKAGAGTLILGGANDYEGGTVVSAGVLQGDTTSLQDVITNNASLVFNQTTNGSYSSVLSGTGSLTKQGTGTVTLSGANTYGGGTLVSAGRLVGTTTSLQGDITNNAAVSFDQNTDGTYGGVMSGSGSLTKAGTGTTTLTGANTYSGGTLVSAGRLVGTTTTLQGNITNNSAVTFEEAEASTYGGTMSGTGSMVKDGAGDLTMSGANTYSGGTLVSAGRLVGTTTSLQGAITNNATVTFDQSGEGTYSGAMSGSGSLTKTGAGAVTLSGANAFTGAVAVEAGTLALSGGSALADTAAVTLSDVSGVTLQIDSTETIGSLAGGGATGGTLALGANTLTVEQSDNKIYTGAVSGDGTFVKSGAGTLTLNRSTAIGSSFTLRINQGVVDMDRSGSSIFGMLGAGNTVELNGGTLEFTSNAGSETGVDAESFTILSDSTILINRTGTAASHSTTMSTPFVFANGAAITLDYSGVITSGIKATTTYTGSNTLNSSAVVRVSNSAGGNAEVIFSGAFSDGGSGFGLTKLGAQTMTLSAENTYSGDTIAGEGTLQLSGSGRIGDASLLVISNGATMNFNNISDTVKGLSGAGAVTLGSGTLTTSNAATDSFSGAINGTGGFVKDGSGTQILSGENSYSGGTTLSAGVLRLQSITGAGTGTITQSDGTTLEIDTPGTIANNMSVYNVAFLDGATLSGAITVNNATFNVVENETSTISGVVDGSGGVTKTGLGQLTLSGDNSYTGATAVSAGVLELASTVEGAAASTSSVSVANGATLLISQSNQVNNGATVSLSGGTILRATGVSEQFGSLTIDGNSTLDFGSGTAGTMSFGVYEDGTTPSALLTVNNFFGGNTLTFGTDLSAYISESYAGTGFTSTYFNINSISGGFTSNWNGSTFTITAIPEPSTYLAAAGLLSLMLWPSRKRLLKDAKKILGLTPPMRDRLAAKRA